MIVRAMGDVDVTVDPVVVTSNTTGQVATASPGAPISGDLPSRSKTWWWLLAIAAAVGIWWLSDEDERDDVDDEEGPYASPLGV